MRRIPISSTLAYRALLHEITGDCEQHKNITLNARIFPFFLVFPDSRHVSAICRVRETMAVDTFFVRTTNSTCVFFQLVLAIYLTARFLNSLVMEGHSKPNYS